MKRRCSYFALCILFLLAPLRAEPMSLSELVEQGAKKSRVFILNEAHDGDLVCSRTRRIGVQILPLLHAQGYRLLALEAVNPRLCEVANAERRLPPEHLLGYTDDPDMVELLETALELGWNLASYDDQGDDAQIVISWMVGPDEGLFMTPRYLHYREQAQARRIALAIKSQGNPKTVVWCGNGHGKIGYSSIPAGVLAPNAPAVT